MTTPSAEIMITPELNQASMRKFHKQFEKGFDKLAKDTQKTFDDSLTKGGESAFRRLRRRAGTMFNRAGGALRSGYDRLGGARGLATGVFGLGLAGMLRTIDRADEGAALISALLGENTADQQIATANAAGLTTAQFAQFTRTLQQQGGFREQQDINDVIFDLNERAAQARIDDGVQTLENYQNLQGQDLLYGVLSGISRLSGDEQALALADLGFGGETGQRLLATIQGAETAALEEAGLADTAANRASLTQEQINAAFVEMNRTEGERLAKQLEDEAALAKEYRKAQLEFNQIQREKLFDQIDSGDIKTLFGERERELEVQQRLIDNFEANQKAATEAREGIDTAMQALETVGQGISETLVLVKDGVESLVNYFGAKSPETFNESRAQIEANQRSQGLTGNEFERTTNRGGGTYRPY